jgi:predicted  nucleic acid-binding Zn-ribbon protein
MPNTTTPTTTDTPRTDADRTPIQDINGQLVYVNTPMLCKQLERELSQLKKQQLQLMNHLNDSLDEVAHLNRHLSGV